MGNEQRNVCREENGSLDPMQRKAYRAISSWFRTASSSKPSFAIRWRRHRASYSWSSTPSSFNRLASFFSAVNTDAISLRATGFRKTLSLPNPSKIGSDLNSATAKLTRTSIAGQIQRRKPECKCLTTTQIAARILGVVD